NPWLALTRRLIARWSGIYWGGPHGPRPAPWPAWMRSIPLRRAGPGGPARTGGSAPQFLQTKCSPERIHNAFRQTSGVLRSSPQKDMPVDDRAKKQCKGQVDIEIRRQFALLDAQLHQAL